MGIGLNEVTYEQILKIKLDQVKKELNSGFLDPQQRTEKYIEMARLQQELDEITKKDDDKIR